MDRAEKAALKIHSTAIKEGENYARTHGCTIIEETAYGRGYKSGYIKGAVDTEKELIEKAVTWMKTHTFKFETTEEIDLYIDVFKQMMEE